jgi:hypothetical protein
LFPEDFRVSNRLTIRPPALPSGRVVEGRAQKNEMPKILTNPEQTEGRAYRNSQGETQCVELIKQTLGAPRTAEWRAGRKIRPGDRDIARGTAIATFVDGRYPQTGAGGKHAALYLEQNEAGIVVLDQWKAQGVVKRRTIRWKPLSPGSKSNDANAYSEIEW